MAWPSGIFDDVKAPLQRSGRPDPARQLPDDERAESRLGRAERRAATAQRHRRQEVAVDRRRAGPHELAERHTDQGFGVRLGNCTGRGDRAHRTAEDERHDDRRLVRCRVGLQRAGHRGVPHQGRIDVDVAHDHAVVLDHVGAEDDAGHVDRIGGALTGA